jgi:hypothetical protein
MMTSLVGCGDGRLGGTASGTENTITIAAVLGPIPAAKARVRPCGLDTAAWDPVRGMRDTAMIEARADGEGGFRVQLPPERWWMVELLSADSSHRAWVDSVWSGAEGEGVVATAHAGGSAMVTPGALLPVQEAQGVIAGLEGAAAWIGVPGTSSWTAVFSDGRYSLELLGQPGAELVVVRAAAQGVQSIQLQRWTALTGELQMPDTVALPGSGVAMAVAEGCSVGGAVAAGSVASLFHPLLLGSLKANAAANSAIVLQLDLCANTWSDGPELAGPADNLVAFADGERYWFYHTLADTLWGWVPSAQAANSRPGTLEQLLGLVAADYDEGRFQALLYRPSGLLRQSFGGIDSLAAGMTLAGSDTLDVATDSLLLQVQGGEQLLASPEGQVTLLSSAGAVLDEYPLEGGSGRLVGLVRTSAGTLIALWDAGILVICEEGSGRVLRSWTVPTGLRGLVRLAR